MFKKSIVKKPVLNSFDMLFQITFKDNDNVDPYEDMKRAGEQLKQNKPVLGSFRSLTDQSNANYILAFLSGISFALEGNVYSISNETYLFVTKESLKDGSIKSYLKEVENK